MERCVEVAGRGGAAGLARRGLRPEPLRAARAVTVRAVRLLAGLALFAAGLALMVRADLGLSAWDVLHDSLRSLTPLTFGEVVIAVSVIVLAGSVALGIRPGVGTVANTVLVGVFADALLRSNFLQDLSSGPLTPRVFAMLAGVWGIALGSALYIGANLGAGPRDALMLGVARRSRRSAGAARAVIEACVLIVGMVLGGSVGVGTVAFVILIGPAINASFRLFGMEPPRRNAHTGAATLTIRAISAWGRRGQLGTSSTTQASRETGGRI